ncbi:hypothetical protein HUO09_17295 [Vibrio sp. Y2-5]|uniref:hypothetical protein n=1 Tax=Vibrio sp. Y2-5 TaxID=2743977 RepID=UPI0016607C87|nr:hypothetical protein [Vibrio sp. Y2-5]MBD0788112.1 hypothetical protein [Vibrio sp. Y2-5]
MSKSTLDSTEVIVYPSEFGLFKQFIENLCHRICYFYRDQKYPSAFKRNDAGARAFGYKSHSDLIARCKGATKPEETSTFHVYALWRDRISNKKLASELQHCFKNLSPDQICHSFENAPPKQTEFKVVDGTPICQFSPLDPDISNEQRTQEELDTWWNTPFVLNTYDGQRNRYTLYVLNGGAWDRATGQAWCDNLEDALKAARDLKNSNTQYRDYGEPEAAITLIKIPGSVDEHEAVKLILSESQKLLMYAGKVKNVLEYVSVQFVEQKDIDLRYVCTLLNETSIDGMYLGTSDTYFPFNGADIGMDGHIVFEVDDHYLAQFIALGKTAAIKRHFDSSLPKSPEDFENWVLGEGRTATDIYFDLAGPNTMKNNLQVVAYTLDGLDYYTMKM